MASRRILSARSAAVSLLRARLYSGGVSYPIQMASVTEDHAALYKESLENPERFWGDLARTRLRWVKDFHQTMDCDMTGDKIRWFLGGKINVSGEQTRSNHTLYKAKNTQPSHAICM